VEDVDLQQTTVSKFTKSWAADVLLGVHPSLITLRLVSRGARKPSAAEEEAAALHEPLDPSRGRQPSDPTDQ
jgi:hypothetical protein